jgi:colanic acid biosynthesis glycosyl transferase WcaI
VGRVTRVLVLSQYYHPEGFIPTSLAEGLVARGWEVEVLTAFPHYREGRIYGGYRQRLWLQEEISGVPVARVPLYPSHDRSALRRILTYCSFCASASILGRFLVRKPDLIYVYHPPTTSGIAALLMRALRGRIPILYHVQDLWPEAVASSGMVRGRGMLRLLTRLSRFMYRRAERILTISPGFKAAIARHGVDPARIDVLYNWTDEAEAQPVPRDESLAERLGMTGRFSIVYAGNLGTVQDLDTVLEAAKLLRPSEPSVQFLLVGGGTEEGRLRDRVEREGIPNVRFLAHCSRAEVAAIMGCGQVALVPLMDDPAFDVWIPGKTQACLAMGTPILLGIRGDAAELVTKAEAGLCYEPSSPQSLAEAVSRLVRMPEDELTAMGRSGREYYLKHLCFDKACARIAGTMGQMVSQSSEHRGPAGRGGGRAA